LGRFDPQVSQHVLTTFIDTAKLWDAEIFGFGQPYLYVFK
jgi:hypothetical protein